MIALHQFGLIAALLSLAGCAGSDPWLRTGEQASIGEIQRDASGEPVLPSIVVPPPVVVQAPPASLDGRTPAKPVSCQHYRRCL